MNHGIIAYVNYDMKKCKMLFSSISTMFLDCPEQNPRFITRRFIHTFQVKFAIRSIKSQSLLPEKLQNFCDEIAVVRHSSYSNNLSVVNCRTWSKYICRHIHHSLWSTPSSFFTMKGILRRIWMEWVYRMKIV